MTEKTEPEQRRGWVEYAPNGLIGVLTPQANTTVEPEYAILCPPGYAWLNARLTSPKAGIAERLVDYADSLETQIDQFANAPIDALAFATTGASYLIGREAEDALVDRVKRDRDLPLVTAGRAVCDALALLEARRIGLVSPYPPDLTEQSIAYWQSRGFQIGHTASVYDDQGAFHPIYALAAGVSDGALDGLKDSGLDAIVMLGTGLPTLAPIARLADWDGPPVLSCMLALVWRSVLAAGAETPNRAGLMNWINGRHWATRVTPG